MLQNGINEKMGKITEILKYVYVVHIIMAFCSLIAGSWITKITPILVLGLGGIVLLYRLMNFKKYLSYPFILLYVLFVVLYGITTLVNVQYGFIDNAKIIIWMTLQIGALYLCDIDKDREKMIKELRNISFIIISLTTIMNLIGIWMLFSNYCVFRDAGDGHIYLVGIAAWGRLYGIHTDPNYGAVQTVVALLACGFFILKSNKKIVKIICGIVFLINAMHLSFSGSRTGLVALMVSSAMFAFLYVMTTKKKVVTAILFAIAAIALVYCGNNAISASYNGVRQIVAQMHAKPNGDEPSTEITESEDETTDSEIELETEIEEFEEEYVKLGRDEELSGDVSNRRFDLWNNSVQVFKTAPLVGISFGNIVSYCQANLPDSYLLTNDHKVFNAFHNMFMDLLASQGILGVLVFVVIIVLSLLFLFKNKDKVKEENKLDCCFMFSAVVAMVVASFFVSEILYVHNQVTVFFWILWGCLMQYYAKEIKEK